MRCTIPLLIATALAAADAAPAELAVTAVPTQVSRSSNLWFDEGQVRGGQDSLQVGLHAVLPDHLRVSEVLSVELVSAIGQDGNPLVADEHGAGSGSGGEPGSLDITVSLAPPAHGVRMITTLTLTADIRVAAEGLRRATLKPAKAWIAKRMRIDGFPDAEVELEDLGAERLILGMSSGLAQAVENLAFRTAAGTEIDHQGWNDTQEPGWVARRVDIVLPPDGEICFDIRQELGKRRVRIQATNVPIALPDRRKAAVGVLPTTEAVDVEAAAPPPVEVMPVP